MKHILQLPLRTFFILLVALLVFSILPSKPANAAGGGGPFIIFSEDTSEEYLKEVYEKLEPQLIPQYTLDDHWNPGLTATGDGSGAQGGSLTLTWSIIPDGTLMPGFAGEATCASNLVSQFNAIYGNGNWQAEIANVFAQWASTTGNIYAQVSDDGASWPFAPGSNSPGSTRGDIRIGGCYIDGNPDGGSILAYNFFPNGGGDMKIDTADTFYSVSNLTTGFHNVISHEHGHGAGIEHVCPINKTKLMEPFLTTAFIGLQHDDIRAAQRHYGDPNELIGIGNDSVSTATDLGIPTDNIAVHMQQVSIDDNSDSDWYKFTATDAKKVDVTLTPIGSTYLSGPQLGDGSCSSGSAVNSLAVHNLGFQIVDSDMSTVLVTGNANSSGIAEAVSDILLGTPGVKYIRVFGDSTNSIQLYNLQLTVKSAVGVYLTKTASPSPIDVGQPFTYTLQVTGTGAITATNIIITDTVPANTILNPGSLSGNVTYAGTGPGSIITWTTGISLAKNQILQRTFEVTTDNGLSNGSTIVNTGHVSASNLTVGQYHTISTIVNAPVLTTTVSSAPAVIQPSTSLIAYTVTMRNVGDAAATNVIITNTIPASTTYVANSASNGGVENSGIITWSGTTVNAGAFVTRTFNVTVSNTITNGDKLTNTLSATSNQGTLLENISYVQFVGAKIYYFPLIFKNN